ncbi:hypothetical protein [Variovorax sp. 350MFTsu5.1]|uniref:hypothetical protein n=1 Tax=Variovorax sp. 350MFTsu5.1 TaxID=3158365 RepID=UPI003AADBC5D
MTQRRVMLVLALGATLLAVYSAPAKDEAVVQAAERAVVSDATPRPMPVQVRQEGRRHAGATDVLGLRSRDELDGDESNLFATLSWERPPANVEASPPPATESAAPLAPPAPLQLLGRYQEGDRTAMFATFNGDSVVLWAGENINPEWRVDAIETGQVVLTYLPLGQKQSLPWTSSQ